MTVGYFSLSLQTIMTKSHLEFLDSSKMCRARCINKAISSHSQAISIQLPPNFFNVKNLMWRNHLSRRWWYFMVHGSKFILDAYQAPPSSTNACWAYLWTGPYPLTWGSSPFFIFAVISWGCGGRIFGFIQSQRVEIVESFRNLVWVSWMGTLCVRYCQISI